MNLAVFSPKEAVFFPKEAGFSSLSLLTLDPLTLNLPTLVPPTIESAIPDLPMLDLPTLVRQYQLVPQLLQCMVIGRAIASITITDAEREQSLTQFHAQHQLDSPEKIEKWLQLNHLNKAEIEAIALRTIRIEKFKLENWGHQIESYYLERKADLDRVVYSLIRTKNEELAYELYYRLQGDEQPFEELAHQFSEGAESQAGGRIGPVPMSQPHPALRELLKVSQPGQLWSPRRIDEWFVIVRLEQLAPVCFDTAVKQYLLNERFETWVKAEVSKHSQAILQSLDIV
jgi:parvulin-like peptidyl-prolyl isomerase